MRAQLDDFINGVSVPALPELREWIGSLRFVRLAERETEAGPDRAQAREAVRAGSQPVSQ